MTLYIGIEKYIFGFQIKMKNYNTTPVYTFQQFNDELNEFYKYLKDNKYTDKEIRHIFTPLRPDTKKIKLTAAVVFSSVILVILLYLLTYNETFSWNLSAIGRIALIKILPYWDWTHLKNEKCLIAKYISPTTLSEISFNCDLCENIQQIDVYNSISEDILMKRYLDVDTPVIIKKSWQKSDNFMEHISQNPDIANSVPCNLATNVYNGAPSVKKLIEKTHLFEKFFLHFQNCDYFGMKQFRGFAPRPSFLPPELSPVQYNWLLWSKNYNTTHFKQIALVDKVAVVGQIMGANFIKLLPRNNCETECPHIDVKLNEGESLIFTSLWNLEYKPSDSDENIAVILELH
jgi:hypothetical protein